jgi:hypothetical protein
MPEVASALLRLFVRVTVFALLLPTPTLPKLWLAVERAACWTPMPVRLTLGGVPAALSVIEIEPLNGLDFELVLTGVKFTPNVQDFVGANEKLGSRQDPVPVSSMTAKGPLGVIAETTRVAVPVLVRCTVFMTLVVSIACFPKLKLVGLKAAAWA